MCRGVYMHAHGRAHTWMIFSGSAAHGHFSLTKENQTKLPGNSNCLARLNIVCLGIVWLMTFVIPWFLSALMFLALL